MSFQKIPLNPGVYVDDTPSSAELFFTSADKIRFVRGRAQVMGGWEYISTVALTGICRGLHAWQDNSSVKWLGLGTHTNLYLMTDSLLYDCTPIVARGHVSISFTTTLNSAVVTADWTSHGLVQGQAFDLRNSTVSTVGGVTINTAAATTAVPSPQYIVLAVNTVNQITFTAAQQATSNAGPTAATVDYRQYLAPGLQDSIGALGYGTGVYSTGSTYSSASAGVTACRTWSISNFGQNMLASPRGGKIYELYPITSAPEKVTNGDFSLFTSWTTGAGWTLTGSVAQATVSSAALSQISLSMQPDSYGLISFDMSSWTSGVITVAFNGSTAISAQANGTFTGTFYNGSTVSSATLSLTGLGLSANVDNVSLKQLLTAEVVPNAPTQNTCMIVTPEGFVMVGGTIVAATGLFNPMHLRWSGIGSTADAQTVWTPASTNLSSFVTLAEGSRIVGMKNTTNEVLVWTDKALYAGTYVNNSSLVYSFRLVGTNCGLIGPNAATVLGGSAYWMDPSGNTYTYSGGQPQMIKSTMSQDLFSHLSAIQQDKVFASAISQFNDVIWYYPDSRDGSENSRYSLLCTMEAIAPPQGTNPGTVVGCFAPGTFAITAQIDSSASLAYPVAVDSSGFVRYHEKGATANGGNWAWSLTTGAAAIGNGDTLWGVRSIIPDFENFQGGATLTANGYKYPQSTPVATGPFMFTGATEKVDLMSGPPIGREVALAFAGNASPASGRLGNLMMDPYDTGMAN